MEGKEFRSRHSHNGSTLSQEVYKISGQTKNLITWRLWQSHVLRDAYKLAFAVIWKNQPSKFSTVQEDWALDPKRAAQWDFWATCAQNYLQLVGYDTQYDSISHLVQQLAACPFPSDKKVSSEILPDLHLDVF